MGRRARAGTDKRVQYLSPRKVALVDSAVREKADDRTAYIFLPGGLGTMDGKSLRGRCADGHERPEADPFPPPYPQNSSNCSR